jgi:hypothetical protein
LKFTYKFEFGFGEPCDEWLEAIEEMCNKILGNYNKKEDEALRMAFGACKKRRLNRVFDVIVSFTPVFGLSCLHALEGMLFISCAASS